MVTGKLMEAENPFVRDSGLWISCAGSNACNSPQSWMALGGWFPAASRDIWFVPDGYARAEQERGGNLAPQEE